jgi:lipid II isoglutaminyl synthase (glutamine-hydrolysing)
MPSPLTIRICHLYPRLLSVAGDRGNLLALTRRCAWRGIGCLVTEADVGEAADLAQADLILLHGGQLLGRHYAPPGGALIEGLGVLDVVTEGGPTRFMGHVAAECDLGPAGVHQLAGFENHSGRTYLGSGVEPLGQVLAGAGNNGADGTEGARYREVYATYLHGPVLPKNPWLADHLLSRALAHRYRDAGPLAPLGDQAEAGAQAAALRLALRPAGKWRAAAGMVSRIARPSAVG